MVGAARASSGMRDGLWAQPRPSNLRGLGLSRVAGPSVPTSRGVMWANQCQPGCLKAGTCTWCCEAGEGGFGKVAASTLCVVMEGIGAGQIDLGTKCVSILLAKPPRLLASGQPVGLWSQ